MLVCTMVGTLASLLEWVESKPPRGEFVLVVAGARGVVRGGAGEAEDEEEEVE